MTLVLLPALLLMGGIAGATDCGTQVAMKGKDGKMLRARQFDDGSIVVRAPLAVNPDGGPASYTVGDHGFTYMANGLDAWRNGKRETCDGTCTRAFKVAEAAGFAAGTAEFCVFGMEVEPLKPNQERTLCPAGAVVGNGRGRLVLGEMLQTVGSGNVQAYRSTTSLQHIVSGQRRYLNSETIPIAVTPRVDLLGHIVWVGGAGMHGTYAIVGDKGPAFGEGSIALHQLVREGSVTSQQPGPIPAAKRCIDGEMALKPPFESRPDGGRSDRCKAGYTAKSDADVRAYVGIDHDLDFVIMGKATLERKANVIQTEVTITSIEGIARAGGYDDDAIRRMIACLKD
ncbi:MAG: hypothetical protein AB7F38_00725 [Piscinibacter sp.]